MDAKYIACLMLFLTFSVLSGSEPEVVMAVRQAEPPVAEVVAENPCHGGGGAVHLAGVSLTPSAQANKPRAALSSSATEDILHSLSCLVASL
jgi:hypothetical protein